MYHRLPERQTYPPLKPASPTRRLNQQHMAARELLTLPVDFVLYSLRHHVWNSTGRTGADAFTIMKLMERSTVTVSQKYVEALNQQKAQSAESRVGTNHGTGAPAEDSVQARVA